ncbi:twin-arginine translocation signal domain-containing protein [Halorubellus sp. JP-L1]|uniref:twin-arginine translocation signal domain-containing protein n=1 Tax=Halorubellus sp. JP-L1 TaxID=2715753 RepID=UPI00140BE38F|nr:twin-arginine translocation signal domain-containing protein [Halorubellus sp. JP-L1]NHN40365.1 twin-arginine translocation signal domain-containing protein [Halorubellus sp. JP-L1]
MELTRRDAMGALAAAGVAVGASVVADRWMGEDADPPEFDEHALATTIAVGRAVYPSDVENVESFVRTYALTRSEDDDAYRAGMADAVAALDDYAREWRDAAYVDLGPETAETVLHEMGVDVEDPDPEGVPAERVRFYLVNELLYALYTTDTGGALVGVENPQGYPGGTDSYQRGPNRSQELEGGGDSTRQSEFAGGEDA